MASTRLGAFDKVQPFLEADFQCRQVDDGWALRHAASEPNLRLLVFDPTMPGAGGLRLIEKMRDEGQTEAAVIALIDSSDQGLLADTRAMLDSGFINDIVPARFSPDQLLHSVWHVFDTAHELGWDKLPPIKQKMLKVTRSCFSRIESGLANNTPVTMADLHPATDAIIDASISGDSESALEALRGHHNQSFTHALSVAAHLGVLGVGLNFKREELARLVAAGLLHDVGKLKTPLTVLGKPAPLDDDEWLVMREHVVHSGEILSWADGMDQGVIDAATQHHEKLDGSGYPNGLKRGEISEFGALTAVADVFAALTETRNYKPKFPLEKVFGIMDEMAGPHLEENYVKLLKNCVMSNSQVKRSA